MACLILVLVIACKNNNNNSEIFSDKEKMTSDNIIINKDEEILRNINYIPENFFDIITPNSPIDKIKELFGIADKIHTAQDNSHTSYFYNLDNAYLLIDSKDKESISVISIESKGVKPFVKIGKECPMFYFDNLQLGKSTFNELPLEYTKDVELSRDRCESFAFKYGFQGRPCSYYNYSYGTFVKYDFSEFKNIDEDENNFIFSSWGIANMDNPKKHTIDFIIIGDDDIIKKSHTYGEGIHCDIINLN